MINEEISALTSTQTPTYTSSQINVDVNRSLDLAPKISKQDTTALVENVVETITYPYNETLKDGTIV